MESAEFNERHPGENPPELKAQCPEALLPPQSDLEIVRRLSALLHFDEIERLATILSKIKMDLDQETL